MSISTLASAAAATHPSTGPDGIWAQVVMFAALLIAALSAIALGVFRPNQLNGPLRYDGDRPLWPLACVFGLGMFVFILCSAACLNLKVKWLAAVIPAVVTFTFVFRADRTLSRTVNLRTGFTASRFADGVGKGLLALLVVIPLMVFLSAALEGLYEHIGYVHPAEHPLLKQMAQAESPVRQWLLIAGAVLGAPFTEEYLFRGFLQTMLRQAIGSPALIFRDSAGRTAVAASPSGMLNYENSSAVAGPSAAFRGTWVAIILTSLAFAIVHDLWTAPLIFVLSICLGYAYERTGSLWTPITIHLGFNAISTAWYLLSQHG